MKSKLFNLFIMLFALSNIAQAQSQATILWVSDISYPSGNSPSYTHIFQLKNNSNINAINYHLMPVSAKKMVNGSWVTSSGLNTTFSSNSNYFTLYAWMTGNVSVTFSCYPNDGIGRYKLYFSMYDTYDNLLPTLPSGHLNTEFNYYPTPTGVSATAVSSSSINITWNSTTGADYYNLYRNGTYIATVYSTSYTDNVLTASTQYCYKIKAYDSFSNTGYSSDDCATTDADIPPTPAGVNVSAQSSSSMYISWNSSSGATSYKLYRDGSLIASPNTTYYTDNGLSSNTNYCYKVKACNGSGCSGYSSQVCDYTDAAPSLSINPTTANVNSTAGTGSTSVTSNISWSAVSSNTSWLTITSGSSGSNNGTINYSYTANTSTSSRTETITVSGSGVSNKTLTVTQAGVSPSLAINPTTANVNSTAGTGSTSVTSNISWIAVSSNTSWLTITSGSSGSNNGTINYSYTVNTSSSSRTETITVSGSGVSNKTLTVTQAGVSPSLAINPTTANVNSTAGTGSTSVTSNISWNAVSSNTSWLTITSGSSGSNNGAINYSYTANTSTSSRTATITVSGSGVSSQTLTVIQDGNIQTYCSAVYMRFPQENATGMPQSAKLDWEMSPIPDAVYELIVTDVSNNVVFSSNSITDTYYQFSGGTLFYDQTYQWKVRALLNGSPVSDWSNNRSFTIKPQSPDSPAEGSALGHFNDAVIYKGNSNYPLNSEDYEQCVAFVKRYQNVVYGLNMPSIGHAFQYYGNVQISFGKFPNGGSYAPQIGDIVCLSGGYGHVAIIRDVQFANDGVNNDFVYVAQQNVGSIISNHISQQVSLTYSNGTYTIANFAGKTVEGWRRALPTVSHPYDNEVFSTTTPMVIWLPHTSPQSYRVDASKQNPVTGCYEPISGYNGATIYAGSTYYTFPSGILEAGGKYRLRVGVITQLAGYVQTEPIYFEIAPNANSVAQIAGQYFINTQVQNSNKNIQSTSIAANILITQKINGMNLEKGYSDENGNAFIEVAPELNIGDTLIASGTGVISQEIIITQEMLLSNNISILLVPDVTNFIANPSVYILNNTSMFIENVVELKVTAQNHTSYRILDFANSNDTLTAYTEYMPDDSLVTYSLSQVGINFIQVRFLGADTVDVIKTVYYNPSPTGNDVYAVTIIADNSSLNSQMFINGSYAGNITDYEGVVTLPHGYHQFSFTKDNYGSIFASTIVADTIYLSMNELSPTIVGKKDNSSYISILPNPSNGLYRVECNKSAENVIIIVYDLQGNQIINKRFQNLSKSWSIELDLSNFASGSYLVKIQIDEQHIVKSVIKK